MEETIDLKEVLRTIKKRRILIRNVFAVMVIATVVVSFLIPPTYEAETTLRVKQPKGLADSLLADLPMGSSSNTKQLMITYAEILKSRTVVEAVINKTQADKEEVPDYEEMLKRIMTVPVKDSELLKIKVTAKSAEEAQLVANTLVDTFTERMTLLVRSEQSEVRKFIGERMVESKKELEKAENRLEKYKTDENIAAPTEETKAIVERLSAISKLSAENAVALASAQAKVSSANKELAEEKPGFIADSPLIQQYKGKLADLEVQLVTLSQNFTEKHPQIMSTRAAIMETKAKLNMESASVLNAESPSINPIHLGLLQGKIEAEADIAAGSAQKEAINKIVADSEKELNKLPAKEQGLVRVMRDAAVAQEIYVMLAKRHEEARISEVMQPTDVQVIDVAAIPIKPISPKKTFNVIIAAALGLFIGLGLAFMSEYMNRTVKSVEDVRDYLTLPVLGSIPHFDSESKLAVNHGMWANIKQLVMAKTKKGEQ
ncbi:GumC family protein [Pelosinus fermentans]|uniref:Lipopolysaccharide biosynthesis protein n=1 Tax=Pelosinus fermentans JBW45 TaxID=1192197 RepID=I9DDT1_9FIRM|nr:GNVR domain-containing protein [Pelosinus fermentans]AJQ26033.1 lipopolysaccharide biosynthesis protein [Pelosinus fermentans JBW45]